MTGVRGVSMNGNRDTSLSFDACTSPGIAIHSVWVSDLYR